MPGLSSCIKWLRPRYPRMLPILTGNPTRFSKTILFFQPSYIPCEGSSWNFFTPSNFQPNPKRPVENYVPIREQRIESKGGGVNDTFRDSAVQILLPEMSHHRRLSPPESSHKLFSLGTFPQKAPSQPVQQDVSLENQQKIERMGGDIKSPALTSQAVRIPFLTAPQDREHDRAVEEMKVIRAVCGRYHEDDVYNMDETVLYWKHALYSSLAPKAMREISKMILLLCVNSTGSDRLPVWVIASEKKPDSLDRLDSDASGVVWYARESISMTSDPMREWLLDFYSHIGSQRSVILLLDNLSAHQKGVRLAPPPSNIRIQWLPPGTTDIYQPLDQGAIRAFKNRYRKTWQMHIIEKMYKEPGSPIHRISPELAVHWIVQIWKHSIKNQTIHRSFRESSVIQSQPPSPLVSSDLPDLVASSGGGFVDLSEYI